MTENKRSIGTLIIAYVCVLMLVAVGLGELLFAERESTVSQTENRRLQGYPEITAESFFSGEYMKELESWLSDNIFYRDGIIRLSNGMLGLFDVTKNDVKAEDITNMAEPATDEQNGAEPMEAREEAALLTGTDSAEEPAVPNVGRIPTEDAHTWLQKADGTLSPTKSYSVRGMVNVASAMNLLRETLGEDGRVFFLCSPSSSVMNSVSQAHKYEAVVTDLPAALQGMMEDGVVAADEAAILGDALRTQDVFSVLDHHWTALGASYAADWMISESGLPRAGYYEYRYRLMNDMTGPAYTHAELDAMKPEINVLQIPVPLAPYGSYKVRNLTEKEPAPYLTADNGSYWGYAIYTGGIHGPYRLLETGFHTGRCAILIGDSFKQAFLPYIAPYYDRILFVDPRDSWYSEEAAGASLAEYMEEYETKDVYFITCDTGTPVDGTVYSQNIRNYLGR